MKTIELSTGTLLVVDKEDQLWSIYTADDCKYLGHPSEITGEVWGKVCEVGMNGGYENYNWWGDIDGPHAFDTPLQSGLSLCAAHNIQDSDVLLFKAKN